MKIHSFKRKSKDNLIVVPCITDFDGVLGLDFFEDTKFCIDMKQNIITTLN